MILLIIILVSFISLSISIPISIEFLIELAEIKEGLRRNKAVGYVVKVSTCQTSGLVLTFQCQVIINEIY